MLKKRSKRKFDYTFPEYSEKWKDIADVVKKRDGYRCTICGALGRQIGGTVTLHAHHKISKRHDGTDTADNLQTICIHCHKKKHPHMGQK